jgi:phosphoglycerate kinase
VVTAAAPRASAPVRRNALRLLRPTGWNEPVRAFKIAPFHTGTMTIAKVAAQLTKVGALETIAGGGDTIAALNQAGATQEFTYVSTAGGAFLEWLEGKQLPGVEALRRSSAQTTLL